MTLHTWVAISATYETSITLCYTHATLANSQLTTVCCAYVTASSPRKIAGSPPNLHMMVPGGPTSSQCQGQRSRDMGTFAISQKLHLNVISFLCWFIAPCTMSTITLSLERECNGNIWLSTRQLSLMSKCCNELLRHWRSGFPFLLFIAYKILNVLPFPVGKNISLQKFTALQFSR